MPGGGRRVGVDTNAGAGGVVGGAAAVDGPRPAHVGGSPAGLGEGALVAAEAEILFDIGGVAEMEAPAFEPFAPAGALGPSSPSSR